MTDTISAQDQTIATNEDTVKKTTNGLDNEIITTMYCFISITKVLKDLGYQVSKLDIDSSDPDIKTLMSNLSIVNHYLKVINKNLYDTNHQIRKLNGTAKKTTQNKPAPVVTTNASSDSE